MSGWGRSFGHRRQHSIALNYDAVSALKEDQQYIDNFHNFVYQPRYHYLSVNSNSHSVNGDIAIQWEWSNFDPSQNPNPLTDYDKTLHNWLCPRDEHVTQNLCQSAVRKRLAKCVKYKASSFLFLFFFPDSPTEVTRAWNFMRDGSKHALWRKEVPFWGPHDGRQHFRVQIPQNRQKLPFEITYIASGWALNSTNSTQPSIGTF